MRFESDADVLLEPIAEAHRAASEDALSEARREVRSRTGAFARSLEVTEPRLEGDRWVSLLGSPLASAKTKETGAFVQAKRAEYLAIPQRDGSIRRVKSARIPATPVVTRAGPRFIEYMAERLRRR